MEIDTPAWVAFAAAGDLAELRLLLVPKSCRCWGSQEKRGRPDRRSRRQISSRRCSGRLGRGLSRAATPACAYCGELFFRYTLPWDMPR